MAESLIVISIVGVALAYAGGRVVRTVRAARTKDTSGCAAGCGCSDT